MTLVFGFLSIVLAALLALDVLLLTVGGPDPNVRQPTFGLATFLVPLVFGWWIVSAWAVHGFASVDATPLEFTLWHGLSALIGAAAVTMVAVARWGMEMFVQFIGCEDED